MALVLPSQRTDWSGKMKATGLAFAPGVAQFEDASQQATVVKKSEQQVWFPAKKYGWGWGPPICWQGWAVVAIFLMLTVAGTLLISKEDNAILFVAYFVFIFAAFIVVCRLNGEKPRWRWGKE